MSKLLPDVRKIVQALIRPRLTCRLIRVCALCTGSTIIAHVFLNLGALFSYHICPKLSTSTHDYLLIYLKYCLMEGKQCCLLLGAASTLFTQVCLFSEYKKKKKKKKKKKRDAQHERGKTAFMPFANSEGPDERAHSCSLV